MTNPVLNRLNKVDNGRAGRNAEKNMARRTKGRQQIGSGAIEGMKGDIIMGEFLIENKTTVGDSFSIKRDWLYKIYQEALEKTMNPAFSFQFTDARGNSEKRERWVCITEALFLELTQK